MGSSMYIRCFYKMIIASPEVEFPWRASHAGMCKKTWFDIRFNVKGNSFPSGALREPGNP